MLKHLTEKSDVRDKIASPAVQHAKKVLAFIYEKVVLPYWMRLALVACLGALTRFLTLISFVAALKGVLVAINAEQYAAFLQKVLENRGYAFSISSGDIILGIIGLVVFINICADVARHARFSAVSSLQERFLAASVQSTDQIKFTSDRFLIDRVAPAIDVVARLVEILLFSCMIFVAVAVINLNMVLFLIPIFALIPLPGLMARRRRLQMLDQKKNASRKYESAFPQSPHDPEQAKEWIETERKDYIAATRGLQKYQLQSKRIGSLVMAVGIIALIAYLPFIETGSMQLLSIPLPIIFIVLALRQVLSQANEFGRDLSTLLELRTGLNALETNGNSSNIEKTNLNKITTTKSTTTQ